MLFTCLATRVVPIEIADSMNTDLYKCFEVFCKYSGRGQVSVMRSDNGTNFVGAERELSEALRNLNHNKVENAMLHKCLFSSAAASHQGAVWVHQVHTVRRILNDLLKEQSISDNSLHTIMCKVESIINNRPFTSTSGDPNDLEPLTPNHLLLLKSQPSLSPGVFNEDDLYAGKHWKQVQYLSDLFWSRWTRENAVNGQYLEGTSSLEM